jgi:hypothetical protein
MIWRAILGFVSKLSLFVAMLTAMWFGGRKSAQADIKAKQAEKRLKAVKEAGEVQNEVEALDIDTLKQRSTRWLRNSKR